MSRNKVTIEEVKEFVHLVAARVRTCLLLETPEAADILDNILEVTGIDMIHIGLNDMHISLKMNFMFELLANGKVDEWMQKIKDEFIWDKWFFGHYHANKCIEPNHVYMLYDKVIRGDEEDCSKKKSRD